MLSRFLNGQTISGYTKKNTLFEGVVQTNSQGEKAVIREDGKWILLSNLNQIKQTGAKLNKVYESRISEIVDRLDPAKLKFCEMDRAELAKEVVKTAALDDSNEDLVKEADAQLSVLTGLQDKSDDEIAEAAQSDDSLEPFKKDAGETDEKAEAAAPVDDKDKTAISAIVDELDGDKVKSLAESMSVEEKIQYNKNRQLILETQMADLKRQKYKEDSVYDIADNYDDDEDWMDEEGIYEDNFDEDDDYIDEVETEDPGYMSIDNWEDDDIDEEVDSDFESALDDYEAQGGIYSDESMLECLSQKLGGDAKLALKETNNIYDAVCHLAEQVKSERKLSKMKEIKTPHLARELYKGLKGDKYTTKNLFYCSDITEGMLKKNLGLLIQQLSDGKMGQSLETNDHTEYMFATTKPKDLPMDEVFDEMIKLAAQEDAKVKGRTGHTVEDTTRAWIEKNGSFLTTCVLNLAFNHGKKVRQQLNDNEYLNYASASDKVDADIARRTSFQRK